jgi:hypothetical protein
LPSVKVAVTEGKVEVHLADGRVEYVRAGDRLASAPPVAEPVTVTDDEPAVHVLPAKKPPPAVAVVKPLPAPAPAPERRALVPEWKRQAEAGHYAKAVGLVEEQGVDVAMRDVSSDDLLLFADAARLARRAELGRSALTMLRQRFQGSADAAEGAFRLGRMEFDAQHFAEAGTWFDAYVGEAPQGAFIAEAMGRRLDAWQRAKDSRASKAATEYLDRYSKGAYAPLAQKVLQGP